MQYNEELKQLISFLQEEVMKQLDHSLMLATLDKRSVVVDGSYVAEKAVLRPSLWQLKRGTFRLEITPRFK